MMNWRPHWPASITRNSRRWLGIAGVGLVLLATAAGVYYWAYPSYRARQELAETRRLLDDLELAQAKQRLETYLKERPNDGEAHLLLARTDRLIGLMPTAWSHLRQAEALSGPASEVALEK